MKKWIAIFSLFFITGCVYPDVKKIEIDMMNSDQDSYGTVLLQEVAEGVNMTIDLEGLPPGEHAMHFHEKGSVSHQILHLLEITITPKISSMDC